MFITSDTKFYWVGNMLMKKNSEFYIKFSLYRKFSKRTHCFSFCIAV